MNHRRDFPQDRYGRSRDDERAFSREQHRGGPYGGQHGGRASNPDWDDDWRDAAQFGASQDRFGGYSGSLDYGNPYEPRQQASDWSRQNQWDEDRFGYPEAGSYGREMSRSRNPGYAPKGRFAEDRYSWGQMHGDSGRSRDRTGGYEQPRHFDPRQGGSSGSSEGQRATAGESGDAFAGGRSRYGGGQGGTFGGWGIPSGSELGGYGMNQPYRGSGERQNWSGSNWGDQSRDRPWGAAHSGRFGSDFSEQGMRGRTPKGYTRSDERIKDDVCEQLYRTPDIDVSDVTVEARNGTVMLEGSVPDRRMKHRIEDLCEQCLGVQDVDNRIRVQRADRGVGSRSGSFEEDRAGANAGGTAGATERSNKKSTGVSGSQH